MVSAGTEKYKSDCSWCHAKYCLDIDFCVLRNPRYNRKKVLALFTSNSKRTSRILQDPSASDLQEATRSCRLADAKRSSCTCIILGCTVTTTIFSWYRSIKTYLLFENTSYSVLQQKEQTITKVRHTNAFPSTHYNTKSKRSLKQQNVHMCLTLHIKNTCSMFT